MEKQYTPDKQKPIAKKEKIAPAPVKEEKKEAKPLVHEDNLKTEDNSKSEQKAEKKEDKKITKKEKAVVDARDLPISKKHSMAICRYIRWKQIEPKITELQQVVKLKRAIPMKGEVPHRHGNIMSGRYPVNASKVFINLLKTLNANSQVNGIENPIISKAVANDASRPFKRGGSARFKRTNVYLEATENKVKMEAKK